jgi:glycosyltransferase involved in cell wall biosynthesis
MVPRLLYVQFTDPAGYPPIEHSARLFAERGWEVLILGIGAAHNLQLRQHPRIKMKTIRPAQRGWQKKIQYLFYMLSALYWTYRWRPSWIYASDPLACPIVWLTKKFTKVKVLYHEHDSPNLDQVESQFMRAVYAHRAKLGREAELCVLPQHARLREFLKTTRRTGSTFCVWNCPRLDEIPDVNADEDDPLIIYYHGSITSSRLPAQAIIAASRFKGAVRIEVAGYEVLGSIGYIQELAKLAAGTGVAGLFQPLGSIARRDLLRTASRAHVGLAFVPKVSDDINLRLMVGASNKAFDYMACCLPLLVSDLPDWVSTFVEPGYGRACDPNDVDSIEAELRWYLDHPDERRAMGRRCREQIRKAWNYETTFANVIATLENSHKLADAL